MENLENCAIDIVDSLRTVPGVRANNIDAVQVVIVEKLRNWQDTGENPPRLITSVGGSEETPSVVAPANIVTGLEVLKRFTEADVPATFNVRFASQYAVDANNLDLEKTTKSTWQTAMVYATFIKRFYPDLSPKVSFEVEQPIEVDSLPKQVLRTAGYFEDEPERSEELSEQIEKLSRYGKNRNPDIKRQQSVRYLLSHTTIFEDVIADDTSSDFVIKVGSPSEQQFSAFQSQLINDSITYRGLSARLANPTQNSGYNQVSIFGPRIGSRPPYYKQDDIEVDVLGGQPAGGSKFAEALSLPETLTREQKYNRTIPASYQYEALDNEDLKKRYKQFFGLLAAIGISPVVYSDWLKELRSDLGGSRECLRINGADISIFQVVAK